MIFDPVRRGVKLDTAGDVKRWRARLRRELYRRRSGWCDGCGKGLYKRGFEVHEGIVTRKDVQGWRYPERAWIFSELNCVLLCPACHRPNAPSRQEVWAIQCGRYGEAVMREWYCDLPWKLGKPPRLFWDERQER